MQPTLPYVLRQCRPPLRRCSAAQARLPHAGSGIAAASRAIVLGQRCRALAAGAGQAETLSRHERQALSRHRLVGEDARPRSERWRDGEQRNKSQLQNGSAKQSKLIYYMGHLGRTRQWERALEYFAEVKWPCVILRSALIAAVTHAPDPKHAQTLFDATRKKSLEACNAMINMHARAQRFAEARAVLDSLEQYGLKANATTYGGLVAGHAAVGDVESAIAVLDEMEAAGVQPSKIAYGAAMGACVRSSDTRRVQGLLRRMEAQGLEPNVVHLTTLLITYASRGDEGRALGVFEDMKRRQLQPDVVAYTSLLNCLCSGSALPQAERLWAEMQQKSWKPTAFAYNAMLRICAKAKAAGRFYELLREMDERGIRRNKQIQASLMRIRKVEDASGNRLPWLRGPLPKEEPWPPRDGAAEPSSAG